MLGGIYKGFEGLGSRSIKGTVKGSIRDLQGFGIKVFLRYC